MKHCIIALATLFTFAFSPTPAHAQGYRLLPECAIRAVVGSDFTQLDLIWLDNYSVVEYAFPTQWQAAQRIGLIEQEFACDVRWERA
jgi:hypothetical protein